MKSLIIFCGLVCLVQSHVDLTNFDWDSVKPVNEIQEWRDAHPGLVAMEAEYNILHKQRVGRIINGVLATPLEYPYMAGIILHFDTGNGWCGGSLISQRFVLTAANCVHIVPSSSVVLGAQDKNNVDELIRVTRVRIHPQYDRDAELNDIATLELMWEPTLTARVGLVRLPNRRQVTLTFDNQQTIVAGWGVTVSGSNEPVPLQFLRSLRAPVITNLSCRIRYPAYITASNICTDSNDGTPCRGDQGGGLVITEADGRRTLVGIFSFQFSLGCERGWPPVFARVTSFLDFIEQNSDVRILETWE